MYSYSRDPAPESRFAKSRADAEEHTEKLRGQAVRTVAGHAHDAEDLGFLLAMLGLEKGLPEN